MAPDEWERQVREAEKLIDAGWYAAVCVALFYACLAALKMISDGPGLTIDLSFPGLLVSLAIGVARRSRVATFALIALNLLLAWLAVRVDAWLLFTILVFSGYWYVRAMRGVLWWHRLRKYAPGKEQIEGAAA